MNVHVDLSRVLESTIVATVRDELYLNWEWRNCAAGRFKTYGSALLLMGCLDDCGTVRFDSQHA